MLESVLWGYGTRAIAASTCYDIYSADGGECVAKVEREWMSMTPKYKVGAPESTREYAKVQVIAQRAASRARV